MTTLAPPKKKHDDDAKRKTRDVCHLTSLARGPDGELLWQLGRPLCGADAPRCPGGDRDYKGWRRCPDCGRPICPACLSMEPGA